MVRFLSFWLSAKMPHLLILLFKAEFVDVIHTDEWRAGTTFEAGHADFWLNVDDGVVEPGCPPIKRVSIFDVIFATGKGDESK